MLHPKFWLLATSPNFADSLGPPTTRGGGGGAWEKNNQLSLPQHALLCDGIH